MSVNLNNISNLNQPNINSSEETQPSKLKPVGFLWKLTYDDKNEGYLLGTIHLTPPSLLNFNSETQKCFDKSKIVAVEIVGTKAVLETTQKLVAALQMKEIMQLSADQKEKLRVFFEEMFQKMNLPIDLKALSNEGFLMVVAKVLPMQLLKDVGVGPGMDDAICRKAYAKSIPVVDLESLEDHTKSLEERILFDYQNLAAIADAKPELRNSVFESIKEQLLGGLRGDFEIWESGNIDKLEQRYVQAPIKNQKESNRRNQKIADKIDQLIRSGQAPFCLVGCSHAIGLRSILRILQEYGYKVEQIRCEEPV